MQIITVRKCNRAPRLLCLTLLIGAIFGLGTAAEAATIRISAPKVILELTPGEVYSGEIVAENPTEEPSQVKIYAQDWIYAPGGTGEKIFTPAGTTPLSATGWIKFSPSEEVVAPFGRIVARYTITVPDNASGSYYSVLFFETILGSATDEEGVNVLVAGRIGSLFFIEIKGTADRQGRVKDIAVTPPQGSKPMEISTTFENTGNTDISLGGNLLIMDADGMIQGRGDLNKIYTFPGGVETGTTQWVGRLAAGAYDLILTYDLGKGKSLVEERSFTVV